MESQKQVQKVLKGYKDKTIKGLKEYLGMNENKINTLTSQITDLVKKINLVKDEEKRSILFNGILMALVRGVIINNNKKIGILSLELHDLQFNEISKRKIIEEKQLDEITKQLQAILPNLKNPQIKVKEQDYIG